MHDVGQLGQLVSMLGLDENLSQLECLYSGPRHTLYCDKRAKPAVVIKVNAAPSVRAAASLKYEYEVLRDLDLPGIVRVLGLVNMGDRVGLTMNDLGGSNLTQALRSAPLSIALFLDLAVQLAEAVSRLHEAGIIHRDIHPGNIVWNPKSGIVTLCDFALARTLSTPVLDDPNPNELEGTLAYMSPERTGRTGRSVDGRTDLYSLGATFYQMLTGSPPFAERDAVALAHAQIARLARPPHELNSQVPLMLSHLVLRLLEKEPTDRYQTAQALAADLREARRQWLQTGTIQPFPLAVHEIPRGLRIPDQLYGRDEELQSLTEAFKRASGGGRELVLVTGGPGIGKSALVDHLGPSVSDVHGYYAVGKFDQLQRSVPFSGVAQALRSLVRQLLMEPEAALEGWRERIEDAVTPNGQLLVTIVPELERILGQQPEVPEVGPVETKNRFQLLLMRFLRVFAQPEHPLVLFLDDLQWVDAASLQLIVQCANDSASHHLLIIGAYRDGEVGPSHALMLSLAALRDAGCDIHTIHLEPLRSNAIAQLAADTFGEDASRMKFLAELLMHKSAGNPFFVRRLLHLMHARGIVRFNVDSKRWFWDESEIERVPISDNVLDVMVLAINRLPLQTKRLLETGACIGHRFDLATLSELTDLSESALTDQLRPAIEDGLLVQVRDAFQMPASDNGTASAPATLQFAHDRVQQAAYGLLSDEDRQIRHHSIGRRLLDRSGHQFDEKLFEIVDQFNLGESQLVDDAERATLVDLNLAAGRKAKESAAYRAAFEYLSVARRLLGAHAWVDCPDNTFAIHRELAESAYLAGEHVTAEEVVETSLKYATSKVAKAELYGLRVLAATVASDWERALHWGREGLSVFGLEWPLVGLAEAIQDEVTAVMRNLGTREIENLIDEPEVNDSDIRESMRLLSLLGAPAYFSGTPVMTFILSRAVNLSLMHGPSPYSAFAFVLYGGTHNALTGQYDIGYSFGKLALALAQRFGNRAEECRTVEVYGVLVHHWKAPLREGLPLLKEGFRAGIDSGELAFAAFNLNSVLINALPAGLPLSELLDEAEVALDFATTQKNRTSFEIAVPYRQIARALAGTTSRPGSFEDEEFDETRFLADAESHATALGHYWVTRLQLAYLMGDYDQALVCSMEAEKRIAAGIVGMITSAEHVFYTALTVAATATPPTAQRAPFITQLCELHGKLVNWARHCPENFSQKVSLIGAEIARLEGRISDASTLYRAAIAEASRQRFVQDEALAHELRARCLLGDQEPAFAAVHFQLAQERYRQWGATVKVRSIDAEFLQTIRPEGLAPRSKNSINQMALIRASQAISSETTPERLFEQILRVVIEVAGAQRGVLALATNGSLRIHAQIEAAGEVSMSLAEVSLEDCVDVPSAILRYVQRTKEFLLLSDAGAAGLFTRDPMVQQRQVRSVLCVPLLKQSSLVGLIYLENNAMAGAFAAEFVEVGKILAAQAVISLENSSLLKRMQQLTGELEERVSARTRQLTDEIAARDKAEMGLKIAEARQALLLKLSDALRSLTDADVIRQTALRLLGEHTGLARTFCFKVERDTDGRYVQVIERAHVNDRTLPDFIGSYALEDFGSESINKLAHGLPVSIADVQTVDELTDAQRATYRILGVMAVVNVPATNDGGIVAGIGAHDTCPHQWTTDEVELIREVATRTLIASERARAEAALREADRQKDDFLAMLAHELRNPLASISNASELMTRTGAGGARSDALAALLKRQTTQLTRLVDDLLDLSRISRGRITLEEAPVEVGELVQQALETVQSFVQEKAHRLLMAKPTHALYVHGDKTRLVQAISNVIHNAAKYTDRGGEIYLEIFNSEEEVGILVRDNGVGISAEILPSLFGLFVQSERTLDRSQGGLGIGLSVVKRLIEMHRGSVQASSRGIGQGSTFTIRLPRIPGPQAQVDAASSDPGLMPRRVLIVDDNVDAADSLAMLLELDGHSVNTVYGAVEALEAATRLKPDLVFLDIGLPVMDGYEVARRLRSQIETAALRLVAVTGYGQKEDRERALASGFDDHLVKPVTLESLKVLFRQ
jgi:predicted ATPase/signal transduction histidine kinase/CheY-like chemotaxis protein